MYSIEKLLILENFNRQPQANRGGGANTLSRGAGPTLVTALLVWIETSRRAEYFIRLDLAFQHVLIEIQEKCCGLKGYRDYFNNSQYQKDTTGAKRKDIHTCKRVPFSCCTRAKETKTKEAQAAGTEQKYLLNRKVRYTCCNRGASNSKARFNEVHLRNQYLLNNFYALHLLIQYEYCTHTYRNSYMYQYHTVIRNKPQ